MTIYEGVTINIPVGTILSARKGEFCFRSEITGALYTFDKVEYRGNGQWLVLSAKHEVIEEKQ